MAAYKVKSETEDSVTISCGCRGKADATVPLWMLVAAVDESWDLMKAADQAGVQRAHNRPRVMRAAMQWAIDGGHVNAMPKGW